MNAIKKFYFLFLVLLGIKPVKSHAFPQGPNSNTAYNNAFHESLPVKPATTPGYPERDTSFNRIDTKMKAAALRLKQKTAEAREYLAANNLNTDVCFMVDMSVPSGKNRFFVYNFNKNEVEFTALVSHGSGSYKPNCDDQLVFSDLPNSNATSLGRYKIGNSYNGTYGLSYKLYGLDSTNKNAFQRSVVLHSDNYVPDKETYPRHIFESSGCPTVSPSFLTVLDKYMKSSKKPMMLWIYN